MDYMEAKEIALREKPSANVCIECDDAYMFVDKREDDEGGNGPCIVLKETGEAINASAYYLGKMKRGEDVVELREIAI